MNYVIDSYAWIEYFIGSEKGAKVLKLLESRNNSFITVDCCLAEIKGWSLEENRDFSKALSLIVSLSTVTQTLPEEWIKTAEKRFETRKKVKGFGLIDSLILVKQEGNGGKILSGDRHFKTLKNVEYIGD